MPGKKHILVIHCWCFQKRNRSF